MTMFFDAVNKLFDLMMQPFDLLSVLFVLIAISALTGVGLTLVFRFVSNQQAIRKAKDKLQAHVLEVRLFQDQLGVVTRAYGRIFVDTGSYMKFTLLPLAVIFAPVSLLLIQLDTRLGYAAFAAREPILLTAKVASVSDLDRIDVVLSDGLNLSAPPVRAVADREVTWRIGAQHAGSWLADVRLDGESFLKSIRVGSGLMQLSPVRKRQTFWSLFFNPAEAPISADRRVEWISVNYPERWINFGLFRSHWLAPFFLCSILVSLAVKGVFQTEF